MASLTGVPSIAQPNCLANGSTGLIDCGNWAQTAVWNVPSTAVSGVYVAKLTRIDTGGDSHIVFVVRDDQAQADILFQTSDTTWQAYNTYVICDRSRTNCRACRQFCSSTAGVQCETVCFWRLS